ncbi:MAG: DAK2 domain-containing protein [Ruminiclostridium sp.]|nr:DAK2 domain-containing protein [Ruminiclostridium sp.]
MSGKVLRDGIISGAHNIINNKNRVDELNVFPVPDGDTGTNMSMTISNALPELESMTDDVTVGNVAEAAATGMLRGARGNSGVILSLLFRGISKGLAGKSAATGKDFAAALARGVAAAYKSVMKPTEGTVLTVSREASEAAVKKAEETDDIVEIFTALIEEGEASLNRTPELLPALKKAGVVDSGAMGFLLIFKGIYSVIKGEGIIESADDPHAKREVTVVSTNAAGTYETDIKFTYCTEYIVNKNDGCDDATKLRAYLESIGDSVVVVDDENIIKIHVHTDHPGLAFEKGLTFGYLTNMKIENMKEQHKTQAKKAANQMRSRPVPAKQEKEIGFVAVASGAGVEALFTDLGVDSIVRGGQTSNPSTEDILDAILATPAKTVFVLPNNKNIILAAEQAVKLADRKVIVLQSRSIPQGITAMLTYDPDLSARENSINMTAALDNVGTGLVTFAVRDSIVDDKKIKQGDILGMENGRLNVVDRDLTKVLYKVTKHLISGGSSYITVIYGSDVSDSDAQEAFTYVKNRLGDRFGDNLEFSLVNGGQPVYYYMVSVE